MKFIIVGYGKWAQRVVYSIPKHIDNYKLFIMTKSKKEIALDQGFNVLEDINEINNNDKCYITSNAKRHITDIENIYKSSKACCLVEKPFVTSLSDYLNLNKTDILNYCYSAQVHRFMPIINHLKKINIKPKNIKVYWSDTKRNDIDPDIGYHLDVIPNILGIIEEVVSEKYTNIISVDKSYDQFKCILSGSSSNNLNITISRNNKDRKRLFIFESEEIYTLDIDKQRIEAGKDSNNYIIIPGGGIEPMIRKFLKADISKDLDSRIRLENAYNYLKICEELGSNIL